jgi:hypothetical protein
MGNLTQEQLAALIANVVSQVMQGQSAGSKPASGKPPITDLEAKDRALVAGFKRKGITVDQIVLMDRADRSKPHTVKPFKAWLAEGRQVRRGEKSIRGLFHRSQTDPIASAKPAPKAKGKPVAVKQQPRLV